MLKNDYNLGGEQSGHIIMLDYNPTGDGILTSLMLIQILLEKNVAASKLCDIIQIYPQVLVNAKVNSIKKNDYQNDEDIQKSIKQLKQEFANDGRVIIRPSGTEPLIRVMIEGKDINLITKKAKELATLIEDKLK
jgi:phosphoglucosamine mutase